MNAYRLRPNREDIMEMKIQSVSRVNILRHLKQAHGVKLSRTPYRNMVVRNDFSLSV
jgi:hypothetical protein